MNRGAIAIAGAAIAVVSFAIGRATAPGTPVLSVQRVARVVLPGKTAPNPPDDALRVCETKLALAEGILRAQEHDKVGDPVPFPDDLPEQFRPDAFEEAVRRALDKCAPAGGLALHHVDCSEYPCMVFFRQDRGSYNHAAESLGQCALWKEQFGPSATSGNGHFMTDAGIVEYSYASPMPDDQWWGDENLGKRVGLRGDSGREQLMADVV